MFKLAPPGHDQLFDITAPDLCEPHISDVVLRQSIRENKHSSTESRGQGVMAALSPFRRMAGRGFFSLRCSLLVAHVNCNLLCRRLSQLDQVRCYREIAQTQCSRPYDTVLRLPYSHLAWQMSIHIDANTTLQRT